MPNHPDSGLYLTNFRAYDPVIGRWLSRDPLEESGDPSANLYAYVGGSPTVLIDPLGLTGGMCPVLQRPDTSDDFIQGAKKLLPGGDSPCIGCHCRGGIVLACGGPMGGGGGSGPNKQPPLKRIHPDSTYNQGSAKYDLERVRRMDTNKIIESLAPGAKEPLLVKPDGRVFDGNTRIKVLEERGYDVNRLPRTIVP